MNKIIVSLIIAMITITITLAGIKKGEEKPDFRYEIQTNQTIEVMRRDVKYTLGPYISLFHTTGHSFIINVKRPNGTDLTDTELGDLAEQYYRQNLQRSDYWHFMGWLRRQGYTVGAGYNAVSVINRARRLVMDAESSFKREVITAFGAATLLSGNDREHTNWAGRRTGIYDIKTGSRSYNLGSTVLFEEGDVTVRGTRVATLNYRVNAIVFQSPIVLDINGDNKLDTFNNHYKPIEIEPKDYKKIRFREFDISGFGYNMLVEHIGPNDGYLVKPKDVTLTIKTGIIKPEEMFGTAGGFEDGFQKLSLLDTNKDQKLTGNELNGLYVFIDKNMNNKVEKGELISDKDLGITEIGVNHNEYQSYFIRNGKEYKLWDFWPITLDVRKTR